MSPRGLIDGQLCSPKIRLRLEKRKEEIVEERIKDSPEGIANWKNRAEKKWSRTSRTNETYEAFL